MRCRFRLFCLATLTSFTALAQPDWTEIQIPMSDGQNLAADLYLPSETGEHPVILIQTPYNKDLFHVGLPLGVGWDQTEQPYAFVILDWRGFYGSAAAADPDASNGEDGYDAVEWIAEQEWSNGMVATWGPSALGNVQYETAREQPPHLVCCVPQVASPHTLYEQYYPGGILRTEYVNTLGILFGSGGLILANPEYNLLWQIAEDASLYPQDIEVPMLLIAGWYDHNIEDCLFQFDQLKANSPAAEDIHLLIGPWVHGGNGPAHVGSLEQGELEYPTAEAYNTERELQFLNYHMLGEDNGWDQQAPLEYFRLGETGWNDAENWPPDTYEHSLWLTADVTGGDSYLDTSPPDVIQDLTYTYDPEDPSPTIGGMTLSPGLNQGPYDQAPEVESREDNLIFTSLDFDAPIEGSITAEIQLSSDAPDTDLVLRLTEVFPDGRSMLLTEGALRLRYRNGFSSDDVSFLTPGEPVMATVHFKPISHQIAVGNQLLLIVTSSNYSRLNRNMNNGEALYPDFNPDAVENPQIATNTIHVGPSRLIIPTTQLPDNIAESSPESSFEVWTNHQGVYTQLSSRQDLQLLDLNGRIVASWNAPSGLHFKLLSGIPTGMYLLSNGIRTKRIVLRP